MLVLLYPNATTKKRFDPIVVAEAKKRSITLTHPQTEIKQRNTKLYVVRREEILLYPQVVVNHYNQSVYKYIAHILTLRSLSTKFLTIASRQIQNDNDFTHRNNARQTFI